MISCRAFVVFGVLSALGPLLGCKRSPPPPTRQQPSQATSQVASVVSPLSPGPTPSASSSAVAGVVSADPLGAPLLRAPTDDWHVNDHTLVRGFDGAWHMFGILARNPPRPDPVPGDGHGRGPSFGHAASRSLNSGWAFRDDRPFYERVGPNGVLWAPHVIWDGERWNMFYCTGGEPQAFAISRRTSADLATWSEPEVLFRDGWQARDPMVLRIDERNEWALYYTATEDPAKASHHVVAVRTSRDLRRWSERKIVYVDDHVGKGYGPTESPFVVRRNGSYYLFVGPTPYDMPDRNHPNYKHPGYVGTDVFKSRQFDHFSRTDRVGHLAAHAAEIVQDVDGTTYVTSGGIAQGGLYLSRLHWDD